MKINRMLSKMHSLKLVLLALYGIVLSLGLLGSPTLLAANLKLVDKPLVDSTTSDVLPNLMFVLDNSGSMNQNYTPDWASSTRRWEFRNASYNTQYYNPSIRYVPPVTFLGTSYPSYTNAGSVRTDGFFANTNYSMNTHLNAGDMHDNVNTINTDTLQTITNNAHYYHYIPGEYCTSTALTDCIKSNIVVAPYNFAAPIRWCNSSANAQAAIPAVGTCRSIREGNFTNLRAPRSTFTVALTRSANTASVTSIRVNGMEILSSTATSTSNQNGGTNGIAAQVASRLCTGNTTGNCTLGGITVSRPNTPGNQLTITTPAGAFVSGPSVTSSNTTVTVAIPTSPTTINLPGSLVYVDILDITNVTYPLPGTSKAATDRTDCTANSPCTYAQEVTNFSNWYAYYRTRMQGMKTSSSLAFESIDNKYRVGFITINNQSGNYLPVAKYEEGAGQQKSVWYTRLFNTVPDGATPLRNTLSTVGRIFAGKKPLGGTADPMQYACQPNFTLLTTDGYWNEDGSGVVRVDGSAIGNLDGLGTPTPQYEGKNNTVSNSLADVAKYYYDNDIRTSGFDNCNGAEGQSVCGEGTGNENLLKQNMTTLTLGLGIDGTLIYSSDYKTQTEGDFARIKAGNLPWPVPSNNSPTGIDDLWHAAVNGNGTYFSAKTPKELSESLKKALADIQSKVGTGSAAAASSLQPTAANNFEYVASYETVKWIGNLEAREVALDTLQTGEKALWCVENIAPDVCSAPAQIASENGNFFCRTTSSDADKCDGLGGTLMGNAECRVAVNPACNGTMKDRVTADNDTRTILFNKSGALVDFKHSNLNAEQQGYFSASHLSTRLTQWPEYTSGTGGQQQLATGTNLVNYLRGQQGYEDRTTNPVVQRIFRARQATLGDITESQPAFVAESKFKYLDAGYSEFKSAQKTRLPTVYVGSNDGMLHAFNATNGQERWAFVPTPAIPKMWKLADKAYATNHTNYVNGDPFIGDIFDGSWKTILVAGLNGGGRGYYALDITNPEVPKLLWEKTAADLPNLGYTFGQPLITKLNGAWVVLASSGYNNGTKDSDGVTNLTPGGNGIGYLYVLNAGNGSLVKTISTNIGDSDTPSGLAPLNGYVDDLVTNNSALFVIGGDLLGNVWKFDITSNSAPVQLATLIGPDGPQPITTLPQLGLINKIKVAFIGTGKYLELADLNLATAKKQSIYALKIDGNTPLGVPRGGMVQQVISGAGESRTIDTEKKVDFTTGLGWFIDLPAPGERTNVDSLLVNGVLSVPTIVPASTTCSPGGFGYLNYFNYKTGGSLLPGGVVSEKTNSPVVGQVVVYDADGKPRLKYTENDNPTGKLADNSDVLGLGGATPRTKLLKQNCVGCTSGRKYNWRELEPPQQ